MLLLLLFGAAFLKSPGGGAATDSELEVQIFGADLHSVNASTAPNMSLFREPSHAPGCFSSQIVPSDVQETFGGWRGLKYPHILYLYRGCLL